MNPAAAPAHTRAAVLSIGDELVRGQMLDTNSKWLSSRLLDLGVETVEHATIGDSREATTAAITRLAALAPLVVITGGLGPTADDLTREGLADAIGESLVVDAPALEDLRAKFAKRGRTMSPMQARQAERPASARCLTNPSGTAPGLAGVVRAGGPHGASDVWCLPGPPKELEPMFERLLAEDLRPPRGLTTRVRLLTVAGLGEGDAAKRAGELMARDRNPLVGITASNAVLTWRVMYRGPLPPAEADAEIERTVAALKAATGPHVISDRGEPLEHVALAALRSASRTLAVVESCTGGLLGSIVTGVAGSSDVFLGGLLTYSNELKTALAGVDAALIARHGAVSLDVAGAMAAGGLSRLGTSDCLAITGIAGPGGGTESKPVGTVSIAHARRDGERVEVDARTFWMPGGREQVRAYAARTALGLLALRQINSERPGPMLFESVR
jgi:nicotinamide-nucleotide amidase